MANRFELCLRHVLQEEGGYVDHPSDPGGATNWGITRRTLAVWRKIEPWTDMPKSAVQQLEKSEAAQIYRANYWRRISAETLPAGLDLALFDFAVNSGPSRAVKTLQNLLGVPADGRNGPLTQAAVKARLDQGNGPKLIAALCDQRLVFLRSLSTFKIFGRGWTNRVERIRTAALQAASPTSKPSFQFNVWSLLMRYLSGYKTYIIAAIMLLAGLARLLGIEVPAMDDSSAGQLIMQGLAMGFLRHGVQSIAGGIK